MPTSYLVIYFTEPSVRKQDPARGSIAKHTYVRTFARVCTHVRTRRANVRTYVSNTLAIYYDCFHIDFVTAAAPKFYTFYVCPTTPVLNQSNFELKAALIRWNYNVQYHCKCLCHDCHYNVTLCRVRPLTRP